MGWHFSRFYWGLPRALGVDTVLVVIACFTNYGHLFPLKNPHTAKEVIELFTRKVVRCNGYPRSILSNRDKLFINQFWTKLFKNMGTTLKFSLAYHPQTNGQTKALNHNLETYLWCFYGGKPSSDLNGWHGQSIEVQDFLGWHVWHRCELCTEEIHPHFVSPLRNLLLLKKWIHTLKNKMSWLMNLKPVSQKLKSRCKYAKLEWPEVVFHERDNVYWRLNPTIFIHWQKIPMRN